MTQPEDEAREALEELIAAQNAGDAARMKAVLSARADAVYIGTDADEWFGSADWVDLVEQGGGEPSGVTVLIDDVTVHPEGDDVAWAAGHGRFRDAAGRECPVRLSAVLARGAGRWAVVHLHGSAAVPNDELFG